MPIRKVQFQAGNYYHLYNRGNNRQEIFLERKNYSLFILLIRQHLIKNNVEIIAYCLMPNHYHLLVYLNDENLSQVMQRFSLAYTKSINQRFKRVGSLFQGRFQAQHVDSDEYLLHLSRYIHLNPVKANLVKHPQEWEFSSYLGYIGLQDNNLIKPEKVLEYFSSPNAYQQFVENFEEKDTEKIQHLIIE
ncbi:REP-associated tyrosine transposase [Calothrix sp. UHCC 0171]|uniref:REP-associated tyrosine transposase n=1 Tax=Calothrix sp. UHCC 0171 TaxID=3110245 RepID=UPI002B203810|nr:transposase [Calothrix sp. UHCC 0171]MEA5571244.1 transposase [Calothrix sp. UHCC 0171]